MTGRSTIYRICAIALAIAGMAVAIYPQTGLPPKPSAPTENPALGTIQGRVTLPSGDPVNGRVRITLSTTNDPGMAIYTDTVGNFTFANLRQGSYSIEAIGEAKLYDPVTEQVFLPRGARIVVTIALRDKVTTTEKKNTGHVVSAAEAEDPPPDAARKEYEQATDLVNAGKIAEAVNSFKKALAIYPRYMKAHNDLGAQYLKLKHLDEAVAEFEAALDINPKAFNPRLNLGIARVKQKKYSEALEHLNQAISMDSSSAAAHLYLGMVLEETDELPAAERELRTAISLGEQPYAVAHFYLAQLQMKKGDREQTINELTVFLKESPNNELAGRARQILEELKQQ